MIEIKPVRTVHAYRRCPVCRTQLAPKGSNVRITIIDFTRERGYTPAELVEVGVWAEEQR